MSDLSELMEETINRVRQGKVDLRSANTIGFLASIQMRAIAEAASTSMWNRSIAARGFAFIADVLRRDEINALNTAIAASQLRRSRAGARHLLGNRDVAKLANDPRLTEIARQALGSEAHPFRATLFDKSPTSNWLVVWHQDTALPLRERRELPGWGPWSVKEALEQVLALRIHLDDSSDKNGPLRVLPGTHTIGVLTDDAIEKLSGEINSVDCLVPAGGVVAMRPLIVHASSKSLTDMRRRVLHIEYAERMSIADSLELAVA